MCFARMPDLLPRPCPKCSEPLQKVRGPSEDTDRLLAARWAGSFQCTGCGAEFWIGRERAPDA